MTYICFSLLVPRRPTIPHLNLRMAAKARTPSLLATLLNACNATSRAIEATGLFAVYDNINMMVRIAEQILGRKNVQENGTCTTLIPLHDAKPDDLLASTFDDSILNAPPLHIDHLLFTDEEAKFHEQNMVHTILRIIKDLDAMQPRSSETISVHKSAIHPLPSMEIDENSITGNIDVVRATNESLGLNVDDPEYMKYIKIIAGDQLTIACQRSILSVCLSHESGSHAWQHVVLMPDLFHAKIADCHGFLEAHFGKPNAGTRSPGSLGFHNTVLDRLPITLTSLPPFHTCRDLIMVFLYARVLHCLLLVSGKNSLEDYTSSVNSWTNIISHAKVIFTTDADTDRVQELREEHIPDERKRDADAKAANKGKKPDEPLPHIKKGDMVFENAVLFLRDALLTHEFTDAVKTGDSGCVSNILRLWVFSYRGSSRTKYAHEMLHLLHNLICVWTKELQHVILQNWLLNPTGKLNCFVEIDLKIYKADSDGHSWDWLTMISPCVNILRNLATRIHTDLGSRQGTKHTIPNLEEDITALVDSLEEHDQPVPDILSVGMAALTHGTSTTPLAEFNQQFDILHEAALLPLLNSSPATSIPVSSAADMESADSPVPGPVSNKLSSDLPEQDSIPDNDDESEHDAEEHEDFSAESPTLTCFNADDVALDMDTVPLQPKYSIHEWNLDGDDAGSEYDGSDDDSSGSIDDN
ncbi:hypothetical protein C8R45DRAFT_1056470 [Mycena sanguinolenta]|nr:hypothetical protein C8R45DRAFT_1056470 [Mycena sanguinolenta]